MDVNTFNLKAMGYTLIEITDRYLAFRRKRGKWCLWDAKLDKETILDSVDDLLHYKIGDVSISDILDEKEDFAIPLDGGRGASGSSGSKTFKFGNAAGGKRPYTRTDFPARINVATKTKNVESAIETFMNAAAKRPDREHAITLDNMGFASSYVHGQAHSVMIGHVNKGDLVVHNHPGGGSFSDADLINTASDRRSRGIVATYDKGLFGRGYRVVTKGTHFNAEGFTRAVKSARLRGKDYDDAADKWLTRNQKKYGYKFKHVKL